MIEKLFDASCLRDVQLIDTDTVRATCEGLEIVYKRKRYDWRVGLSISANGITIHEPREHATASEVHMFQLLRDIARNNEERAHDIAMSRIRKILEQ